jgi:hypothetical protein
MVKEGGIRRRPKKRGCLQGSRAQDAESPDAVKKIQEGSFIAKDERKTPRSRSFQANTGSKVVGYKEEKKSEEKEARKTRKKKAEHSAQSGTFPDWVIVDKNLPRRAEKWR